MKTIFLFLILIVVFALSVTAQGLSIGSGTTFTLNSATLSLPGNWSNAGTFVAGSGSAVIFNGPSGNQTISRPSGEAFLNLTVNKASGDVVLNSNVIVNGTLTLTSGDINLNGSDITLGISATLFETSSNTVKGTAGVIKTTRNLGANPGNVAGLGVNISVSPALGSTIVERGHRPDTIGSSNSITRNYKITPTNNTGLNATATFYYDDSEMNNLTEANLGLYKSTDNGVNWLAVSGTLNTTSNYITATNIGSFSKWSLFSTTNPPTDVEEKETVAKALPKVYALSQNYPNPFNPSTTIKFDIPTVGTHHDVSLKIYDILGKEVATLVNEQKEAGSYEVIFNASHLASGIYFYKLTAGNYYEVKKMTVMK